MKKDEDDPCRQGGASIHLFCTTFVRRNFCDPFVVYRTEGVSFWSPVDNDYFRVFVKTQLSQVTDQIVDPLRLMKHRDDNGEFRITHVDRQVPRRLRLVGGVKGHNQNEISFPGSRALWAWSFKNRLKPPLFSVKDFLSWNSFLLHPSRFYGIFLPYCMVFFSILLSCNHSRPVSSTG
jgi:hypothetical protein